MRGLLIEMAFNEEAWKMLADTAGVMGFLSRNDEPTPLEAEEVESLLTSSQKLEREDN